MKNGFVSEALRSGLEKKPAGWVRALLAVLATAVFYVFAINARYATLDDYGSYNFDELLTMTGVMFTIVYGAMIAVQMKHSRTLSMGMQLLLCVITGCVLLGKISLLDYVSDDYSIFLNNWIEEYTVMGLKQGLGSYIGSDYTPPYLYLMYAVSRFPDYPWLYMVKFISLMTDVLLSYSIMKVASLKTKSESVQLFMFHIAAILPTVVFNGAYWGQCDGIYTGFCILALYFTLAKKPCRGMLCFGVALSFKLQTVFFLPGLLPLWLKKDVKLRHLLLIPVMYMTMMIPALWGGKSLRHVLTVYIQQAGNYKFMTMNGPSLYQFLPAETTNGGPIYQMFNKMALMLGFAALMVSCIPVCAYRKRLTVESSLLFSVLVLGAVPFFLPNMHERYTFGADVLSLALCLWAPRRVVLPLLFGLASYICYTEGLPGEPIMSLKWASVFMLAGVVVTAYELMNTLRRDEALEVKA